MKKSISSHRPVFGIFCILAILLSSILSLSAKGNLSNAESRYLQSKDYAIRISNQPVKDSLSNGRALNIPFEKYGISIGNSIKFNGIRINFADKYVKNVNGLNITFWTKFKLIYNPDELVNGISLGILHTAKKIQPLNFFLLGAIASEGLNGLSVAGIGLGSSNFNGIGASGLFLQGGTINGLVVSGLFPYSEKTINGIAIGGLAVLSDGNINGVVCSLAGIYCRNNISGFVTTAGYLQSEVIKGVAISGYANLMHVHGLSVALINRTKELHGVQLGLWNYAENNPKGFRRLPFLNIHLSKNKQIDE